MITVKTYINDLQDNSIPLDHQNWGRGATQWLTLRKFWDPTNLQSPFKIGDLGVFWGRLRLCRKTTIFFNISPLVSAIWRLILTLLTFCPYVCTYVRPPPLKIDLKMEIVMLIEPKKRCKMGGKGEKAFKKLSKY